MNNKVIWLLILAASNNFIVSLFIIVSIIIGVNFRNEGILNE